MNGQQQSKPGTEKNSEKREATKIGDNEAKGGWRTSVCTYKSAHGNEYILIDGLAPHGDRVGH
jgi:hypothetical protein